MRSPPRETQSGPLGEEEWRGSAQWNDRERGWYRKGMTLISLPIKFCNFLDEPRGMTPSTNNGLHTRHFLTTVRDKRIVMIKKKTVALYIYSAFMHTYTMQMFMVDTIF